MGLKALTGLSAALLVVAIPNVATAWGDIGHKVTAIVAYQRLTPKARARVDALLAADTDTLTAPDFPSRATWADKYRSIHRETANWHFVDLELDHPDITPACFGFPGLGGQAASAGPAADCVVDKIAEFQVELKSRATSPAEKLLALKFLMHFVGDVHQPLHASDDGDEGGNCIALAEPIGGSKNLHAYWDTGVMAALGGAPETIATALAPKITAADARAWRRGSARSWAIEAYDLSRKDAYTLPARPTCAAKGSVALSPAYQAQAQADAALQLERAGVRLAFVLNTALGD